MTVLSIIALCIFVFGAYAYGSVVVLSLRHGTVVWSRDVDAAAHQTRVPRYSLAMFVTCTAWFVLHCIIGFRYLMGEPADDDWIDLAVLVLVFLFPGLIFHTVLRENTAASVEPRATRRLWSVVLVGLYAVGFAMAVYFPAAIFNLLPGPERLNPYISLSIGA